MDFKWETAKPAQPAMVSLYGSAMAARRVWITLAQRDSDSNIAQVSKLLLEKENIEWRQTLNRSRKRS